MKYTIREHGDLLEKEAASFIEEKLAQYESIWKMYIGNKGNAVKADLPNYPHEGKRTDFAENSYTLLESAFMINQILDSNVLEKPIENFQNYMEFNNAFISFFAHLGRIRDTAIKVSSLFLKDNEFETSLKPFYEARNIAIHGKKVPIRLDDLKLPQIPVFKTVLISGHAWHDKTSIWADTEKIEIVDVQESLQAYYDDLLNIINNQYAAIKEIVIGELKSSATEIFFEYKPTQFIDQAKRIVMPSGSGYNSDIDVEGAFKYLNKSSKK